MLTPAGLSPGVGGHAQQAVEEVGGLLGQCQRVPAQAVGSRRIQFGTGDLSFQAAERRMLGRRRDAVQPGAPGLAASHGEGGAGEQFGVQAVGRFLRGVLADRQGAGSASLLNSLPKPD